MLSYAPTILYLPKQSAFHMGGKEHSTPNTKALSLLFPSTPPFLFTFNKNSQMTFTWEAVICNCYFISALCYHFPFARINISVGIQHSIITFVAWACAFLTEHLSSLCVCFALRWRQVSWHIWENILRILKHGRKEVLYFLMKHMISLYRNDLKCLKKERAFKLNMYQHSSISKYHLA